MAGGFAVHAAVLRGAEALPVTVEVDLSGGIPGMTIVGMPDSAVLEARTRIRCALKACGFEIPRVHITVNLAPSDLRKTGTGFDLPVAAAILAATSQIRPQGLDECLLVGELGLDGSVCDVRGSLAYALLAKDQGLGLVGPPGMIAQVCGLGDAGRQGRVLAALGQLRQGVCELGCTPPQGETGDGTAVAAATALDYADVVDQEPAKRALVIAAAGAHGLLMVGPPGSGKTMLARRMPAILPPLGEQERLEAMLMHSVCGLPTEAIARGARPFRAPHHSVSRAGLVGGGRPVSPGEVSLAHRGVLFLDEVPEFSPGVLQSLRQPMEDGEVHISRVDGSYTFPCRFQLLGASNPCPCGHAGDRGRACTCSAAEIARYQGRIGGALIDRIDVFIDVARPAAGRVIEGACGMSSAEMAQQVSKAREFMAWRQARGHGLGKGVRGLALTDEAQSLLERLSERLALGGRAITRTARVARTIADLAQERQVRPSDVAEACAYRNRHAVGGDLGES